MGRGHEQACTTASLSVLGHIALHFEQPHGAFGHPTCIDTPSALAYITLGMGGGSVVLFVCLYGENGILIGWSISWILDCWLAPLRIRGNGNQPMFRLDGDIL